MVDEYAHDLISTLFQLGTKPAPFRTSRTNEVSRSTGKAAFARFERTPRRFAGRAGGNTSPPPTAGGNSLPLDSDPYFKRIVLCHLSQFPLPSRRPSLR